MTIDEAIGLIPPGWDFNIGSDWDQDTGATEFYASLLKRALGEAYHRGHYVKEIQAESRVSIVEALSAAIREAKAYDANG